MHLSGIHYPTDENCRVSDVCKQTKQRTDILANVSSMFTISRALVSMNPQPCRRAYSSPSRAATTRASFRSHLFPTTIVTGGGLPTV